MNNINHIKYKFQVSRQNKYNSTGKDKSIEDLDIEFIELFKDLSTNNLLPLNDNQKQLQIDKNYKFKNPLEFVLRIPNKQAESLNEIELVNFSNSCRLCYDYSKSSIVIQNLDQENKIVSESVKVTISQDEPFLLSFNQFDYEETADYSTQNTQIFIGLQDRFKMGVQQLVKCKHRQNPQNTIVSLGDDSQSHFDLFQILVYDMKLTIEDIETIMFTGLVEIGACRQEMIDHVYGDAFWDNYHLPREQLKMVDDQQSTNLNIEKVPFNDYHFPVVFESLMRNYNRVCKLSLAYTNITSKSIKKLAEQLKQHESHLFVDLSGIEMTNECFTLLIRAMEFNKQLLVKVNANHEKQRKILESRVGFEATLNQKDDDIKNDYNIVHKQLKDHQSFRVTYLSSSPYQKDSVQMWKIYNFEEIMIESDQLEWLLKKVPTSDGQEFTVDFTANDGKSLKFNLKIPGSEEEIENYKLFLTQISKDRYPDGTKGNVVSNQFLIASLNYLRGPDFKNHEYFGFEDRHKYKPNLTNYGVNKRDVFEFWEAVNHDFNFLEYEAKGNGIDNIQLTLQNNNRTAFSVVLLKGTILAQTSWNFRQHMVIFKTEIVLIPGESRKTISLHALSLCPNLGVCDENMLKVTDFMLCRNLDFQSRLWCQMQSKLNFLDFTAKSLASKSVKNLKKSSKNVKSKRSLK